MNYSVVRISEQRTASEALRDAFREIPWLVDSDAAIMARNEYGIITEGLTYDHAEELSAALTRHGVENTIQAEDQLPSLGIAICIRRAACVPENLIVYDALNRQREIGWEQIRLLAAGVVGKTEAKRIKKRRPVRHRQGRTVKTEFVSDFTTKMESVKKPLWEIFAAPNERYQIDPERFHFNYLNERLSTNVGANFANLLCDLQRYAPSAIFNQGILKFLNTPSDPEIYTGKHAFEEEIRWLIWKSKK